MGIVILWAYSEETDSGGSVTNVDPEECLENRHWTPHLEAAVEKRLTHNAIEKRIEQGALEAAVRKRPKPLERKEQEAPEGTTEQSYFVSSCIIIFVRTVCKFSVIFGFRCLTSSLDGTPEAEAWPTK